MSEESSTYIHAPEHTHTPLKKKKNHIGKDKTPRSKLKTGNKCQNVDKTHLLSHLI